MSVNGCQWGLMAINDFSDWLSTMRVDFHKLSARVDDNWWQLMTTDDNWWQLMTVDDNWWQ